MPSRRTDSHVASVTLLQDSSVGRCYLAVNWSCCCWYVLTRDVTGHGTRQYLIIPKMGEKHHLIQTAHDQRRDLLLLAYANTAATSGQLFTFKKITTFKNITFFLFKTNFLSFFCSDTNWTSKIKFISITRLVTITRLIVQLIPNHNLSFNMQKVR